MHPWLYYWATDLWNPSLFHNYSSSHNYTEVSENRWEISHAPQQELCWWVKRWIRKCTEKNHNSKAEEGSAGAAPFRFHFPPRRDWKLSANTRLSSLRNRVGDFISGGCGKCPGHRMTTLPFPRILSEAVGLILTYTNLHHGLVFVQLKEDGS